MRLINTSTGLQLVHQLLVNISHDVRSYGRPWINPQPKSWWCPDGRFDVKTKKRHKEMYAISSEVDLKLCTMTAGHWVQKEPIHYKMLISRYRLSSDLPGSPSGAQNLTDNKKYRSLFMVCWTTTSNYPERCHNTLFSNVKCENKNECYYPLIVPYYPYWMSRP